MPERKNWRTKAAASLTGLGVVVTAIADGYQPADLGIIYTAFTGVVTLWLLRDAIEKKG